MKRADDFVLRATGIKLLIFGVLAVLLCIYYWAHRPIVPTQAIALAQLIRDLIPMLVITASAGGIGRRILTTFDLTDTTIHRAERLSVEALIGLGAISLGSLVIGLAGSFRRETLWLVLGIATLICVRAMLGWARDLLTLWRTAVEGNNPGTTPFIRFLKFVILVLLSLALLIALVPPVAWDAQTYHLTGPNIYLQAGTIRAHPENFFLGLPQNTEMVYAVAMSAFGSFNAAAPLHWMYGVLGLWSIGGLVRRVSSRETAWIAVLLPLTGFSTWLLFGVGYVDLAVFAYSAAALSVLFTWTRTQNPRCLILLGVIAGLVFGVKYVAAALVIALIVEITYQIWQRHRTLPIRAGLLFGVPFILVFGLWAAKGLLLYQNPIYPFAFGGINWDSARAAAFSGGGGLFTDGAWQLPMLPVVATVFGVEKTFIPGFGTFQFTTGLWLLTLPYVLGAVCLFFRRQVADFFDEPTRILIAQTARIAFVLLVYWIIVAGTSSIGIQTRLMLMAFPAAAILGAFGFEALRKLPAGSPDVRFIVRVLLIVTLILNLLDVVQHAASTGVLDYALYGNSTAYHERNLGTYNYAIRRIEELSQTIQPMQVRFLWEPRSLYCPVGVTCVPDVGLDLWRAASQTTSPEQVLRDWQTSGDTHILVFDAGLKAIAVENTESSRRTSAFTDAASLYLTPVWSDTTGGYTLYQYK